MRIVCVTVWQCGSVSRRPITLIQCCSVDINNLTFITSNYTYLYYTAWLLSKHSMWFLKSTTLMCYDRFFINACLVALHTTSPLWLYARCWKVTMPWVGRLLLSLLSNTNVSALSVSPGYTGFGNNTSENPRLATVVPCVVSGMLIPTRSAMYEP